jgi:putative ABC transport system permease protein
MRIQSVKGRPVREILGEVEDWEATRERWAFRREYRSSHRDAMAESERLVRGAWWKPGEWRSRSDASVPVSLEDGLAEELEVDVGDAIVWDVQGVALTTHVASLREVSWARFEPNFFVVFPEGPLDSAPQTYAALTRVAEPQRRVALQRLVVEAHPNVSALDLSQVQETLETLVARVELAIRFMALFSLAAGAVVLGGAVAASRSQRVREAALLRTLGATRRQLLRILLTEYACLGALSAATAFVLAWAASWALVHFVFESAFAFPFASVLSLAAGVVSLTLALGLLGSVEVFRRPPLEVLRAE